MVKHNVLSVEVSLFEVDAAFTGPATFLMVRGEIVRKRIPTITSWTSSDLRARVKVERDIGGFGKGKVVEYIPDAHQPPPPQLSPPRELPQGQEVEKVTTALKKMTTSIMEFGEVMADVGANTSVVEIIKNVFSNLSATANLTPSPNPTPPENLLRDDDIYNQPSFLDVVAELEAAFLATLKNMTTADIPAPTFNLLTPTSHDATPEEAPRNATPPETTPPPPEPTSEPRAATLSASPTTPPPQTTKGNTAAAALTPIATLLENIIDDIADGSPQSLPATE
ncbi:PREDICTED: mucin-7-like [Ipomoea nil]|uniref:mucin-7-like n=2 Tax=Ipomoea nil TaxID=35883 RepID=UPI000901ED8A|nr:PREDICTED: mucin-7-like [Ipomoea nil]